MLSLRKKPKHSNSKISGRSALNYYRSTKPADASPFQRRSRTKKRGWPARFMDWLIITAAAAGLAYSLILRPQPIMAVNSSAYHPTEVYLAAASDSLKSLKNRNKLTIDQDNLESLLKSKFPEIRQADIDVPLFGRSPTVRLDIAMPSLLLRGINGTPAKDLVVDAKGTVIGEAAGFKAVKGLPTIIDEGGISASPGQSVLSSSEVNFILSLLTQINQAKVPIASVTLPRLAQQLDLRTTDRTYYVKFYLNGDVLIQVGQFLAARQNFDASQKQPLQYLDVRVNGKVFYK